ncbi:MAG: HisA/HisF-related TIM barrel protein [Actinomycetota bacterium]
MSLTIFVAVDVADGKVVRLVRGEMGERTVYGDDAAEVAARWEDAGAEWIHAVDLDGAMAGHPVNREPLARLVRRVGIPVQVSGGVRSLEAIEEWLSIGAARVCLGTRALEEGFLAEALSRFGDRIVPAVDARGGIVRVAGWREGAGEPATDAARRIGPSGAARMMFTDIERDGTLSGPNVQATEEVLAAAGIPLIASGGVSGEADVARLAALAPLGLEGMIIGKALYSGALTLDRALAAAGSAPASGGGPAGPERSEVVPAMSDAAGTARRAGARRGYIEDRGRRLGSPSGGEAGRH